MDETIAPALFVAFCSLFSFILGAVIWEITGRYLNKKSKRKH